MTPIVQVIFEAVAASFGTVTVEQIRGRDRHKSVADARAVAMWLVRNHLKMSYPETGRQFDGYQLRDGLFVMVVGGKDHTTIMSGVRKVDRRPDLLDLARRIAQALPTVRSGGALVPVIDLASGAE